MSEESRFKKTYSVGNLPDELVREVVENVARKFAMYPQTSSLSDTLREHETTMQMLLAVVLDVLTEEGRAATDPVLHFPFFDLSEFSRLAKLTWRSAQSNASQEIAK